MFSRRSKSLRYEVQRQILDELLPLAERSWGYLEAMRKKGWDVVLPRIEFEMSFGQGDDLVEYRQAAVGLVEIKLANPNERFGIPSHPIPLPRYDSPYLKELRARREERFGRYDPEIDPRWKGSPTVCLRKMEGLRQEHIETFRARFRFVEEDEQQRRVREIARHATGLSQKFGGDIAQLASFYATVVERCSKPLGFSYDSQRSPQEYPVFSKRLVGDWDLCLSPEPLVWYPGKLEGQARTLLSLQKPGRLGPLKRAKMDRYLLIEYSELIRYFDFLYNRFTTPDELEVIVKARMDLLSMTLAEMETRLTAALSRLS